MQNSIASRTAEVVRGNFAHVAALIPLLAERFPVIAPDPPGIGDSAIPSTRLKLWATTSG
jgi:hypothetical protein